MMCGRDLYNGSKAVYTNGDFSVALCLLHDSLTESSAVKYGVYNTITGVREAETRMLANATRLCDTLSEAMNAPSQPPMAADISEHGLN